jgi:hypothetical protein
MVQEMEAHLLQDLAGAAVELIDSTQAPEAGEPGAQDKLPLHTSLINPP